MRFQRGSATEAVQIIHGLITSSDMFIMPEHYNLVSYLLNHGYRDEWCLDFRMSNRHSYNLFKHRFTMDDVALYDYQPTLEVIRRHIGDLPIHVISHCLGANSFSMAVFAKVVDGVSSVIANSVGLTPACRCGYGPSWLAPVEYGIGLPYLNPLWDADPGWTRGKICARAVDKLDHECHRLRQPCVRRLQHRLLGTPAKARSRTARVARVSRVRPPGPVFGGPRRPGHLPPPARVHRGPPLRRAAAVRAVGRRRTLIGLPPNSWSSDTCASDDPEVPFESLDPPAQLGDPFLR